MVVWRDVTNLDPATERAFIESTVAGEPAGERLINADAAIPGFQSLDLTFKELLEREDT